MDFTWFQDDLTNKDGVIWWDPCSWLYWKSWEARLADDEKQIELWSEKYDWNTIFFSTDLYSLIEK